MYHDADGNLNPTSGSNFSKMRRALGPLLGRQFDHGEPRLMPHVALDTFMVYAD